jgi:hypothetical protein
MNFRVAGFGVGSVWMNMGAASRARIWLSFESF